MDVWTMFTVIGVLLFAGILYAIAKGIIMMMEK